MHYIWYLLQYRISCAWAFCWHKGQRKVTVWKWDRSSLQCATPMSDRANLFGKFRATKSNQWSYVGDGWLGRKTSANIVDHAYWDHAFLHAVIFCVLIIVISVNSLKCTVPIWNLKFANRLQNSLCNGRYRKQKRREVLEWSFHTSGFTKSWALVAFKSLEDIVLCFSCVHAISFSLKLSGLGQWPSQLLTGSVMTVPHSLRNRKVCCQVGQAPS